MANYYTKISFELLADKVDFPLEDICSIIKACNDDDIDALPEWIEDKNDFFDEMFEGWTGIALAEERDDSGKLTSLVIYSEETANTGGLADAIHMVMAHYQSKKCIGFQMAFDCSKPRIDAFGGGAVFITANRVRYFSSGQWLEQQEQQFLEEKE